MREVRGLDLARAIEAGAQFLDTYAVDVETDHRDARACKGDRHRQADIAEPDDRELARMRRFAFMRHGTARGWTIATLRSATSIS